MGLIVNMEFKESDKLHKLVDEISEYLKEHDEDPDLITEMGADLTITVQIIRITTLGNSFFRELVLLKHL